MAANSRRQPARWRACRGRRIWRSQPRSQSIWTSRIPAVDLGRSCRGPHGDAPPLASTRVLHQNANRGQASLSRTPLRGAQLIHVNWNHAGKRAYRAARVARRGSRVWRGLRPALFIVRNKSRVAGPYWSRPIGPRFDSQERWARKLTSEHGASTGENRAQKMTRNGKPRDPGPQPAERPLPFPVLVRAGRPGWGRRRLPPVLIARR
jgi:hypothetical protein